MEIGVQECHVPNVDAHRPRSRKFRNETALRSLEGQHAINRAKTYWVLKDNLICISEICNNFYVHVYICLHTKILRRTCRVIKRKYNKSDNR